MLANSDLVIISLNQAKE